MPRQPAAATGLVASVNSKLEIAAATIEYSLLKGNEPVLQFEEDAAKLPEASPYQVIVEKMLPLDSLEPGRYTMQVKITDKITKKSIAPSAEFTVQ